MERRKSFSFSRNHACALAVMILLIIIPMPAVMPVHTSVTMHALLLNTVLLSFDNYSDRIEVGVSYEDVRVIVLSIPVLLYQSVKLAFRTFAFQQEVCGGRH